jgi:hypothetical protein
MLAQLVSSNPTSSSEAAAQALTSWCGFLLSHCAVQVGIRLSDAEAKVLCEKYYNEDLPELVNYVAFSHTVDPTAGAFEQMTQ